MASPPEHEPNMADAASTDTEADAEEELQAVIEARRPLKEEIEKVIAPHLSSDEKPPFTTEELIIMAIISSSQEWITKTEIMTWIIKSFCYYKTLAAEEYARKISDPSDWGRSQLDVVVTGFHETFTTYGVPISEGKNCDEVTILSAEARICLRRLLEPKREGAFQFLDLPAELRNRIYEMVLYFPDSEIVAEDRRPGPIGRSLLCRKCLSWRPQDGRHDVHCQRQKSYAGGKSLVFPPFLQSLFLVCRQMGNESIPVLYGANRFSFSGLDISPILRRLPAKRLRHIKNVHIDLLRPSMWDHSTAELAGLEEPLHRITELHELAFTINDDKWIEMLDQDFRAYETIPELQCLLRLASVAEKVSFYSREDDARGCEKFEAFVTNALEQMRISVPVETDSEVKVDSAAMRNEEDL